MKKAIKLIPLALFFGLCTWACSSSSEDPEYEPPREEDSINLMATDSLAVKD